MYPIVPTFVHLGRSAQVRAPLITRSGGKVDSSNKMGVVILSVEIALAVFVASVSISMGLLVAPWVGFLTLAAFALVYVIVMTTSLARSGKFKEEQAS